MITPQSSPINSIRRIFKFFDLYGQSVTLYISKKPKFSTICSGIISMGVIVIIIITFTQFISSWLNNEKMTPIPSSISYSSVELLAKNQTFEYEFNYENYDIYWYMAANPQNGTFLATKDLKKFYSYEVSYLDESNIKKKMILEPCKLDHQDIYLGLDTTQVEKDAGKTNQNRICIQSNFKMGIIPNTATSVVLFRMIEFSLYQCVNSTSNNNSCASQKDIDEIIQYTYVQTSLPKTVYDFKNPKQFQKNIYDYHYTSLDKSMNKYFLNTLTTTTLYIDDGLLNDDYRALSINFNPNIDYDPSIRNDGDPLFSFRCELLLNFQNYYLRNLKLNEIAGKLGGLINTIFLLGKLLCVAYNSVYLKFKLIKSTFLFSKFDKEKPGIFPKGRTLSMSILRNSVFGKITRNFSYCSYLFPSKKVRTFYQTGSKHLHEYLDIRKIIKRLQDLDKLKMILLKTKERC